MLRKSHQLDEEVLAAAARLRARCLALLNGALRETKMDQVTLAARLGVGKAAVNSILRGNGNVAVNSLAEYLAAMGFEIDMVPVPLGEIEAARDERRAPRCVTLTLADHDRHSDRAQAGMIMVEGNLHGDGHDRNIHHPIEIVVFGDDFQKDGHWTVVRKNPALNENVTTKGHAAHVSGHVIESYARKLAGAR